jgi:hypothetical protein
LSDHLAEDVLVERQVRHWRDFETLGTEDSLQAEK